MTSTLSLYEHAEDEDIPVDYIELRKREAVSLYNPCDDSCCIAIDPSKLNGDADEKVKLAHELGHCLTGSFYNEKAACDVRQQHENRADKWAIAHVITADELDDAVANGYTEIWTLAEFFDVPVDFMSMVVCWYTHGNLCTELYF
jgi:Zn-dependent peptidase ImmA (M78 family)